MKADLQFLHYHVVESIYKNGFSDPNYGDPEFGHNISLNDEDIKQAIVQLSVELGEETSDHYVKAVIAGFFVVNSDSPLSEEEILSLYEINATSILFPYLRSLVSDLTCKGDSKPVILPTLNIYKMMQGNDTQDEETDEIDEFDDTEESKSK